MLLDFKCPSCKTEEKDAWVKNSKERIKCPECGTIMEKKLSLTNNQTWSRRIK